MKLEADAGRAWPSVGGRGIALDLSPSASLASSHYWGLSQFLAGWEQGISGDRHDRGAAHHPYP